MNQQQRVHAAAQVLLKEHQWQHWGRAFFRFDGMEWQLVSNDQFKALAKEVLLRNGDFNNPTLPRLIQYTCTVLRNSIPWAPIEWGRAYEERKKAK